MGGDHGPAVVVEGAADAVREFGASVILVGNRDAIEREIDALWTRIGKLLDAFTTDECAAYLRHAGYAAN